MPAVAGIPEPAKNFSQAWTDWIAVKPVSKHPKLDKAVSLQHIGDAVVDLHHALGSAISEKQSLTIKAETAFICLNGLNACVTVAEINLILAGSAMIEAPER